MGGEEGEWEWFDDEGGFEDRIQLDLDGGETEWRVQLKEAGGEAKEGNA